jgi:hypothetical protein
MRRVAHTGLCSWLAVEVVRDILQVEEVMAVDQWLYLTNARLTLVRAVIREYQLPIALKYHITIGIASQWLPPTWPVCREIFCDGVRVAYLMMWWAPYHPEPSSGTEPRKYFLTSLRPTNFMSGGRMKRIRMLSITYWSKAFRPSFLRFSYSMKGRFGMNSCDQIT